MVREIDRSWADLCPELLNLIYDKLQPPSAAARSTGFGSVCKPWRQFHAAAVPLHHHPYRPGQLLAFHATEFSAIPDKTRDELQAASIAYSWRSSGWLLLRHSLRGRIFCCFNPLLPWPENYINLPSRFAITPLPVADPNSPPRIKAAFSSDPRGADDWTLFVIGARKRTFSTFRRGDRGWENYRHYEIRSGGLDDPVDCQAIGFREGKFFCLFGRSRAGPEIFETLFYK